MITITLLLCCGIDVSECPVGYPFQVESSACLRPDGARCSSGSSSLCCQNRLSYAPYWVGGPPPNCFANCSDCNFGDICYGFTRMCDENGDLCEFGSQVLCGWPAADGSLSLDGGISSVIILVSMTSIFGLSILFVYLLTCIYYACMNCL